MGMYTEFNIGVHLLHNTPSEVIDILDYMLSGLNDTECPELPDHPLFKTERWKFMLVTDSNYFHSRTDSSMERHNGFEDWMNYYELNIRCNLKNYDREIELFLNWIEPYMDTHGFIGYMRYEEYEHPWLIYHEFAGGVKLVSANMHDEYVTETYLGEKWLEQEERGLEKRHVRWNNYFESSRNY